MANDLLIYNSTTMTATITMSSMVTLTTATNNAWQGNFVDFGTPRGEAWLARLQVAFNVAPTAGGTLDLYMAWSSATATLGAFPGGCTGVDGAYYGYSTAENAPAALKQLEFIGSLVACNQGSATAQTQQVGLVFPKTRYGAPVVQCRTSAVLSSATASQMLMFTEIRPQIQ